MGETVYVHVNKPKLSEHLATYGALLPTKEVNERTVIDVLTDIYFCGYAEDPSETLALVESRGVFIAGDLLQRLLYIQENRL